MTERDKSLQKNTKRKGSREEKHCICDSRDYSILMICCDYCSVWYHAKCMGVTKGEANRIETYACKPCQAKDDKHIIIYKETTKTKASAKKHKMSTKTNSELKNETADRDDMEKHADSEIDPNKKKPKLSVSNSSNTVVEIKNEPIEQIPDTESSFSTISIKNELKEESNSSLVFIQSDAAIVPPAPMLITKQQKLQEEHPELRCSNCIGCFRDKDCGKCSVCVQGCGKFCIQRVCVQVEELLKQKENGTMALTSNLMEVNNMAEQDDEHNSVVKSKKGRKPKALATAIKCEYDNETPIQQGKRRNFPQQKHPWNAKKDRKDTSVAAQLNKHYNNWLQENQKKSAQQSGSEDEIRQCHGPGCTNSIRRGSKYCSEECGIELAKLRLKTILPQRFNDFFCQQPARQTADHKRLEGLSQQIDTMKQQLANLEEWKENIHTFIRFALKNAHPSSEKQKTEDEGMVIGCPVCAGEFPMREIAKHTQSCFVRSERQTTYGTDYPIPKNQNQYGLYCDMHNKINNTFCKRLRYACAEHYKDEYDLKICGCPLNWYKNKNDCEASLSFNELFLSSDAMMQGGYCQEKAKNCRDHQNWIQTAFSMIDNERMNLLNRMEEIEEQRMATVKSLLQRGDVLSLLCNKTIQVNSTSANTRKDVI